MEDHELLRHPIFVSHDGVDGGEVGYGVYPSLVLYMLRTTEAAGSTVDGSMLCGRIYLKFISPVKELTLKPNDQGCIHQLSGC